MSEWFETREGLWSMMWQRLARGTADARADARLLTLATAGEDGWPEARTVVIRAARPETATIDIHTDAASFKVAQLRADPRATLHVWDRKVDLQIRLRVRATIIEGAEAETTWSRVPPASRPSYQVVPEPGRPIVEGLASHRDPSLARFAILRCVIVSADLVHLGRDHRRALFEAHDNWKGQWVAP